MILSLLLLTASLAVADNGPVPSPSSKNDPARTVEEKQRHWVCGGIVIVGNTRTRQSTILKRLGIYPGAEYCDKHLRAAEEALAGTKLFKGKPKVTLVDREDKFCTVQVQVEEKEPTYPWDDEMADFEGAVLHYLAVGAYLAIGPQPPESVAKVVIRAWHVLEDWPVFKARSPHEAALHEAEAILYLAISRPSADAGQVKQAVGSIFRAIFKDHSHPE